MIDALLYIILLFGTVVLQTSFLSALPEPFSSFPLFFMIGVIVFHRASVERGVLWFLAGWLFFVSIGFSEASLITYIAVVIAAPVLLRRLFARRSIYALEGFGISLFSIYVIVQGVIGIIDRESIGYSFEQIQYSLLFLVSSLYFGFFIARALEHAANHVFLIKRR